jgi:hypothetical protein
MSNDFYTTSGAPSTRAQAVSATMRSEFNLIVSAFDKLPTLTANGSKIIAVNSGASALEAITTTGTGSGVRATSPTLTTPTLTTPTMTGAILGTPTSGTLTNCTLPVGGITGLGSNVAAFLATPSSANLAAAVTDETGTAGSLVFSAGPTFTGTVTVPALLVTTSATFNNVAPIYFKNLGGTARTFAQLFSDNKIYIDSFDGDMVFRAGTTPTMFLTLTTDGRLYGSALHNNAGAVTGTANQYVASGTYTPTITNTTNIDASTARACQWLRVGNVVSVSGSVSIDPTAASNTVFQISLPIASNLAQAWNAGGVGSAGVAHVNVYISANATDDVVTASYTAIATGAEEVTFSFTYVIL